jgi:hypothetical protein
MTRRFKAADFSFAAPAGAGVGAEAVSALDEQRR